MRASRFSFPRVAVALAAAAVGLAPRAAAGPEPTARVLSSRDRWEVGDVARVTISRTGTATVRESAPGGAVEVESVPLGARMDTCLLRCLEVTEEGEPRRLLVFVEDWARDDGERLDPCLKWGFVEVSGTGPTSRWTLRSSPAPLTDAAKSWLDAWFGKDGSRDDARLRAALPDRAVRVGETWVGTLPSFRGGPGALASSGLCDPPEGTAAGFRLVNVEGVRAAQVRGQADWTLPAVPALPLSKPGSWPKGLEVHEEADVYLPAQRARGYRSEVYADARAVGTYGGREARLHLAFATVVDVAFDFGGDMPDPPLPKGDPGRVERAIALEDVARVGDRTGAEDTWRSDVRVAPVAAGDRSPEVRTISVRAVERSEVVLAVDSEGRAVDVEALVRTWRLRQNDREDLSLADTSVIVGGSGPWRRCSVTEGPSIQGGQEAAPSEAAKRWLEEAYGPVPAGRVSLRRAILPRVPVAVGDAWTPDGAAYATRVRGEGGLDVARATGSARLVSVEGNAARVEAEVWFPMKPGAVALGDESLSWVRGAGMAVAVATNLGIDGRPVSGTTSTRARILGRARRADGSAVNVAVEVVEETKADVSVAPSGGR